jgi:hypothetical protein
MQHGVGLVALPITALAIGRKGGILAWIGWAVLAAVVAGVPILPVLVIGSVLTALLAYRLTGERTLLIAAAGVSIVAVSGYLMRHAYPAAKLMSPVLDRVAGIAASPWLAGALAIFAMLYSAVYGFYGPERH